MAVVKFVAAKCPMSYIFKYVMRKEATERKLIDGLNCSPVSACDEFEYVKHQYHKEDGITICAIGRRGLPLFQSGSET